MGGRGAAVTVLMAVTVASVVLEGPIFAAATKHIVGGSAGWTIPSNASFYSDWASTQVVTVGDTLVFNYPTGVHNVIQVPKSGYDACSSQSQLGATQTVGPTTVTLSSAGAHYYICGVGTHCALAQKLAITVAASSSPSPAPSPSPTTGGPAPESPAEPTSPAAGAPGPSASGHSASGATAVQPGFWIPAVALLSAAAAFLLR